jgi:tRNA(Ile)-lysidine synthase
MSGVIATAIDTDDIFAPLLLHKAVGLAVSGGADSLGLLLLVHDWARRTPGAPQLHAYSVDHALRPEAADEAAMVVAVATALGLRARALRWNGDKPQTGVQAAARAARYRLLAGAMSADGVTLLCTAHHRDDQAETVLMRLAHGSGIDGLRGMDRFSSVEGCRVYRPLLGTEPALLRQIVTAAGLDPAEDPGNSDPHYERVRWRQALPQLAELGLDSGRLAAFAERMGEVSALIAALVAAARSESVQLAGKSEAMVDRSTFRRYSKPVGVGLLQQLLAELGGSRKPHALQQVERLWADLAASGPVPARTLHGCLVSANSRHIKVWPEPGRRPRNPELSAGTADVTLN